MNDKLQQVIDRVRHLPLPEREELLAQIEAQLEQVEQRIRRLDSQSWKDYIGIWSNDNVDEMFAEFDRIRHANLPSKPLKT